MTALQFARIPSPPVSQPTISFGPEGRDLLGAVRAVCAPCERGVPPVTAYVASWRRVDKELYPPPAPLDEGTIQVVLSRGVRLRSSRP